MPIITRRFFYIFAPHRQGILAQVAGLASRLFERCRQSVLFPSLQKRMLTLLLFRLRSSTTAGLRLDTPVFFASLQESTLFEHDPFAFTESTLLSSAW